MFDLHRIRCSTQAGFYNKGISTLYNYLCRDENNRLFTIPVNKLYHNEILEREGDPRGRDIEYDTDLKSLRFQDKLCEDE